MNDFPCKGEPQRNRKFAADDKNAFFSVGFSTIIASASDVSVTVTKTNGVEVLRFPQPSLLVPDLDFKPRPRFGFDAGDCSYRIPLKQDSGNAVVGCDRCIGSHGDSHRACLL